MMNEAVDAYHRLDLLLDGIFARLLYFEFMVLRLTINYFRKIGLDIAHVTPSETISTLLGFTARIYFELGISVLHQST